MNLRRNSIMLVALLGLGAYIYFVEFAKQQEAEDAKKMLLFDPAQVTAVELVYPDRQLQLTKDDAAWTITQPIEAKADTPSVENLVKAVTTTEVSRTLEEVQEDRALYGLNAPAVKVTLTLNDGRQLPQLTIGKDTPVGHSVYVQREGEKDILLAPQSFRLGMTKETKDLRDRTVIAFDKDAVQHITLTRPSQPQKQEEDQAGAASQDQEAGGGAGPEEEPQGGIIEEDLEDPDTEIVLRKADLGWAMDKPLSTRADGATIRTFLSALSGLRAQDFVDEPLLEQKEFGLDPPHLSIALTLGEDKAQQTILVGNEKETDQGAKQRYVKRADDKTLFLVGDWVFRDLNKTSRDFRDKTVVHFAKNAVARVEVQRHDGDGFQLTKNADAAWQIDVSQAGTLKNNALGQFVTDLHELKGFEIVTDNPTNLQTYGLQAPLVTIRAYNEAEEKLAGLLIGQTKEEDTAKLFAMAEDAEDGQTIFGLRDYVFDRLNKKPADFWETPAEEDKEAGAEAEDNLEEEQM